ncbi:aldo/keto reductase [bacterium]|nr:aldo/keto reductase [bacterium]
MLYRRFGRTELQMPVLSCGGMRYQHKWEDTPLADIPDENQRNLEATIARAIGAGINHIETARGYGSSERQLGQILPKYPRESLIVQTKVAPEADSGVFRKNVLESLERLNLDYVDLLGLHGINNDETYEWSVREGGCLQVARELQSQGLVRHIGFSTHATPEFLPTAIKTDVHGGFDYVNLHWYWIYQRNWGAILEARKRDMGVFIISPSDKGGMLYNPPEKLCRLTEPVHPIIFNDLFCLSHPEVHTLSIGAAKPGDFDLHVEAIENWWDKRDEIVAPVEEALRAEIAKTFDSDYLENFEKGVPEFRHLPGDTNVQIILWLHMLAKSFDLEEYGKMRYNLLGNAGHWFPGTNAADFDEAAMREALRDTADPERIIRTLHEAHEMLVRDPVKRLSES